MPKRPSYLVNWREIEPKDEAVHPGTGESRGFLTDLTGQAGLTRLGFRHDRLPAGRRTSPPHAERTEEELVFILEGTPDLWQDGWLYRLHPGVIVAWPGGDGVAHAILNNSGEEVRLLTLGEVYRRTSECWFPAGDQSSEWTPKPARRQGPHNGKTGPAPKSAYKPGLPPNAIDWRTLKIQPGTPYPNDTEAMSDFVPLAPRLGLYRLGGGIDPLSPGRRTSWPHAEGDEEEFTFVLDGTPTAWLDGRLYPLKEGDFIGWPAGTGHTHTILNNSSDPALLFTWGEASRKRSRVWYPFHAKYMKTLGEVAWVPAKPPRQGPHDGLPDALRKTKRARK